MGIEETVITMGELRVIVTPSWGGAGGHAAVEVRLGLGQGQKRKLRQAISCGIMGTDRHAVDMPCLPKWHVTVATLKNSGACPAHRNRSKLLSLST